MYALDDKENEGSMYKRFVVIVRMDGDQELTACGDMGIETPWKKFSVDDIVSYNYDEPTPNLTVVLLLTTRTSNGTTVLEELHLLGNTRPLCTIYM